MDWLAFIIGILGFISSIITLIVNGNKQRAITDMQIKELTDEVKKHNGLIDRMYNVEMRVTILEEKSKG